MSKRTKKNAIVETEVKNEVAKIEKNEVAEVEVSEADKYKHVSLALQKGFSEALAAKIEQYIAREDSCAAALTKIWFGEGLTYEESIAFCKTWMSEHKPNCTWGSKRSEIQAHRNWLRTKYWMNTELDNARIKVIGQYEF